jgi:ABC-2 type transport system permease protein
MRLALLHARALTLELVRHPAFVVPTLAFPAVFFLFFAAPAPAEGANARMATFAGFAALGVAFFQFGVGIAVERASPWELYLRTLPVGVGARLAARLLSASAFALAAAALVAVVAVAATPVALPLPRWAGLAAALLAAGVPFALLGIALGYWVPPRAALPVANLAYLALAYAGGLWIPADRLPRAVAAVSRLLPTRALADALTAQAAGSLPWRPWAELAACALAFAGLAAVGYRRDEGRRYG